MIYKNSFYKLILPTLTLLFCSLNTRAQEEAEQLGNLNEHTDAVPIRRDGPSYPSGEAQRGREGMVTVSYIVDENGEVQNAMIEDAFGSDRFVEASLRAVSKFVFEPATENGEAVSQSMTRVQFKYSLEGNPLGASRGFINDYTEIMTSLSNEDANKDSIYDLMIELKHSQVNNLYEIAWYAWVEFNYLYKFEPENRGEIIRSLRTATMVSSRPARRINTGSRMLNIDAIENIYLSTDSFILSSRALFATHLQKNEFSPAMRVYNVFINTEQLKESDLYEDAFAYLNPLYEKIIERIESDSTLVQTGNISSHSYWVQELLRHSFSVENVNGTLKTIDLRCSDRNVQFDFVEDQVWTVPESWGVCDLYLEGEEGTTFEFYSIPEVAAQ